MLISIRIQRFLHKYFEEKRESRGSTGKVVTNRDRVVPVSGDKGKILASVEKDKKHIVQQENIFCLF